MTMARQVATLPGLTSAVVTSGPYDVVVEVDASAEAQRRELCAWVKQAGGLTRLCVCRPTGY